MNKDYAHSMQDDTISRQAAIDEIDEWIEAFKENEHKESASDAHFIKVGIGALPSAQPEQRWIPVSERLPDNENGEDWVVAVVREKETGFCWIPRVMEYRAKLNDWLFQSDDGWMSDERNKNFEVVAWHPLPEPYKGEE